MNNTNTNTTAAEKVEQAYYDAAWDGVNSEGCYSYAVSVARALGGIETSNTNDGNSAKSFAPSVTYEFNDLSSVHITYGGVFA